MWFLIWIVVAIVAAIGELLTRDLFLAIVSMSAIFTAFFALLVPGAIQLIIFAGLSAGGIAFTRPAIKHMLGVGRTPDLGEPRSRFADRGINPTQATAFSDKTKDRA
jgi:membrane protein implicated in regulation of membrane protease activity